MIFSILAEIIGKMEMSIDTVNRKLISYLKDEIPRKYKMGNSPFFEERDVVYLVHNFLLGITAETPMKIFGEFPVHMIAPIRLTTAAFNKLLPDFKNLNNHYREKTGYYELVTPYEELKSNNPFENINPVKDDGTYNRMYEAKYFDLVILNDYDIRKPDEMNVPKIVIEFKFEAAK